MIQTDTIQKITTGHNYGVGLLIRHAERFEIKEGSFGTSIPLTPKGRQDSVHIGSLLANHSLAGAFSSPVGRCVDTAQHILKGAGYSDVDASKNVIADEKMATSYVSDIKAIKEAIKTTSPETMVIKQLEGQQQVGITSLEKGSYRLLDFMLARIVPQKVTLFVTHDSSIMPFKFFFLKQKYSYEKWAQYLEHCVIRKSVNGAFVNDLLVPNRPADRLSASQRPLDEGKPR